MPSDQNGAEKRTTEINDHKKQEDAGPPIARNKKKAKTAQRINETKNEKSPCDMTNVNGIGGVNKVMNMTKTFETKEMLPFSQLRTLNQKEMLQSLEENDKLGIVIKDQLKVAMMDMEKYEKMVDALQEYERLLDWMDEREEYERISHRLESDRVVEYKEGMSLLEMAGVRPKKG
ncbi:hypothetical protein [Paenibacillus sp. Y412MC10]|uniref:hypothetical protein n=1 Tax=Geobacillus sp. (strain Y412MC10) TaxID=481743 RepID=UPI0011AB7322|nr:hypothetical protein [Paenibacillus sp. Y412MC10]